MKQILIILLTVLVIFGAIIPIQQTVSKEEVVDISALVLEDEAIPLGDLVLTKAFGLDSAWLQGVQFHALGADNNGYSFVGQSRAQIETSLGKPITSYGTTNMEALNNDTRSYYAVGTDLLLVYYDNKKQNLALFTLQFNEEVARTTRFMTQPSYDNSSVLQMSNDTLVLLNGVRKVYQKGSLKTANDLSSIALKHSLDMVARNYFSHTNSAGLGPKARIQKANIKFKAFGEALTAGTYTPVEAITAWLNSDGHRPILLGDYNTAGVGIATGQSSYGIYYTLKVIKK